MDNKYVFCGYFKKFLYNDILFSYMYKYMLNGIGESLFWKFLCLKFFLLVDILLCIFEIDRGKVYYLI